MKNFRQRWGVSDDMGAGMGRNYVFLTMPLGLRIVFTSFRLAWRHLRVSSVLLLAVLDQFPGRSSLVSNLGFYFSYNTKTRVPELAVLCD